MSHLLHLRPSLICLGYLPLVVRRAARIDVVDPMLAGPAAPLWPSDHASVVVEFLIERLQRQFKLLKRIALGKIFRPGKRSKDRDNILIVTRSDIFPSDHGAAVKIVETARGLSQHGLKVGIVSDDRRHERPGVDLDARRCGS